jgi:hypothetical protein
MSLSDAQRDIAQDQHRFRVAICGRRFGKTWLATRELARFAREPDRRCWFIAPTRSQGKGIVWDQLKARLMDLNWVAKVNESDLTLTLRNGSEISIKSADAYDRMRGFSVDFCVFDEFADMDPDVWTAVRPTLSDRTGHAMFIGTPKGTGNWSKDIYDMALSHPDSWRSWQYTTLAGGRVSEEEVESARAEMDERTFRQEYEATFETFAGRIFYAFERANIQPFTVDQPEQILIGMDFNIDPMSAVIAVRLSEDRLHIVDEIRMMSSNTQEMAAEIKSRYPRSKITVYPDPASRQRKTSAGGNTDLSILQNAGFVVRAPMSHDAVRDGINSVNSRLCDARGQRHLFVDPKCKYTIESLERHAYKEGTSQPDKDTGYDHMTDAVRYMISFIWPVRRDLPKLPAQRWTHRTT